ncbi:WD40 repeat domain-containing protein [Aerosakkonemataceae cyanobacterium BLCC-F154]|uniref:WD40 repeat domain-containing protein n=1 Tax=Floridaenema fluviatile BLCC-F154 TaxID=3153640 RepID=A0ABV4YDV9_9CYAN
MSSDLRTLTGHSDTIFSLAISRDGKTLVSGSNDKTLAISPDQRTLVSGSSDKTIRIWRVV